MVYVFDTSFVGTLVIPDEKNAQVSKMYDAIENEDIRYIPHLFWYEIANLFRNLVKRKRFTGEDVVQLYPYLVNFNFLVDFESGIDYSKRLLRLCNDYNLSSYDAAYLELADRKNAVLCTLDENLRVATKKYGVAVIK